MSKYERISASSPPKPLERVMIFIDGGYIRKISRDLFGDDIIDYWKIRNDLQKWYNQISYTGQISGTPPSLFCSSTVGLPPVKAFEIFLAMVSGFSWRVK